MIKLISLWPDERYLDQKGGVVDCEDCEEGLGLNGHLVKYTQPRFKLISLSFVFSVGEMS